MRRMHTQQHLFKAWALARNASRSVIELSTAPLRKAQYDMTTTIRCCKAANAWHEWASNEVFSIGPAQRVQNPERVSQVCVLEGTLESPLMRIQRECMTASCRFINVDW